MKIALVFGFLMVPASEGVAVVFSHASQPNFVYCVLEGSRRLDRAEEVEIGAWSQLEQSVVIGQETLA